MIMLTALLMYRFSDGRMNDNAVSIYSHRPNDLYAKNLFANGIAGVGRV